MITLNEIMGKPNVKTVMNDLYKKSYSKRAFIEFQKYYENNKQIIRQEIENNKYQPENIILKEIINYKGKRRLVSILNIKDKFISKLLLEVLEKYIAPNFSENSFAYQKGKGTTQAILKIKKLVEEGKEIVGKIDIKDYFDTINHEKLLKMMQDVKIERRVIELINKFIKCKVDYQYSTYTKTQGIIQGSPLSAILSNIYLDSFDKELDKLNIKYIRYCDDINIFGKDKKEVYSTIKFIEKRLKEQYLLNINHNQTEITNVFYTKFLGYKLIKNKFGVEIVKISKEVQYTNRWRTNSLEKINNEYHIVNEGILSQSDYTILFENKNKKVYIPIEATKILNIYSNIIINSNFFNLMNSKDIIVNLFDKHNRYIGKFIPNNTRKSCLLLLKQVEIYNDYNKRMNMAKDILSSEIYNLKSNLKYYNRRYNHDIKEKIKLIEKTEKEINLIKEHEKLLLCEARIKGIYYSCFNEILQNEKFKFIKRSKRPPQDPINALISFGNTLLYNYIAKEIYKTKLDIRIAYLHSSNNRYESLNLDLANIFKPIIVDKIIFKLINKKIINDRLHFENINGGGYLTGEGKNIVINEFYKKIKDITTIGNNKMSYEKIIRKEIYKLSNSIMNEEKYKAFKYY
mgnify:FL=1